MFKYIDKKGLKIPAYKNLNYFHLNPNHFAVYVIAKIFNKFNLGMTLCIRIFKVKPFFYCTLLHTSHIIPMLIQNIISPRLSVINSPRMSNTISFYLYFTCTIAPVRIPGVFPQKLKI